MTKQALRSVAQISEKKVSELLRGQKVKSHIQNEAATYQAGICANLGLTNKAIERMTGLRPHQVTYRLTRTGASQARQQYRMGEGPVIDWLMTKAKPVAEESFIEQMRSALGLQTP